MRVHEPLSVMDLLDTGNCRHSWPLPRALARLHASERGIAVLLNCGEGTPALLEKFQPQGDSAPRRPPVMDLRTYGIGAQILRDLGVTRMKLLGSPRRMPSMVGYGLEVTGFIAADASQGTD